MVIHLHWVYVKIQHNQWHTYWKESFFEINNLLVFKRIQSISDKYSTIEILFQLLTAVCIITAMFGLYLEWD